MTPKLCRYQCGTMLDAWDDDAKKYKEAGTGGLHTKERCEEMKAKSRVSQGEKNHDHNNDHGNEQVSGFIPTVLDMDQPKKGFVDHTQGQKLKLKILTSTEAEGLALAYNNFGDSHNIRFSQYQVAGSLYTIAIFFEEVPLKQ